MKINFFKALPAFLCLVFSCNLCFAQPHITSFTPTSAAANQYVFIKGTNLSGITSITFGGTPSPYFYFNTDTNVVAYVGTGSSGHVKVTTASGSDSMPGFTFLLPPSISSFSPTSALSGTTINIIGQRFSNVSQVSFGGIQATSFTITSDTTISAVVGNGASGEVVLTSPS